MERQGKSPSLGLFRQWRKELDFFSHEILGRNSFSELLDETVGGR